MLRLANVRHCEIELGGVSEVDGSAAKWVNVRAGDVLFTRAAQPFRAAAVQPDGPPQLAVSSELTIIRPRPAVLPEYLAVVLCTPTITRTLGDMAYQGGPSALPRLRLSDIQRLPIPLPARSLQESLATQYLNAVQLTSRAQAEIAAVAVAILAEVSHRTGGIELPSSALEVRASALAHRWDASYHRGTAFRGALGASSAFRPLLELAKRRTSSLQGLNDDDTVFAIQADDMNEATYMVEGGEHRRLASLSGRMRQRLEVGDVLMCTTGDGEQVVFLDDEATRGGIQAILGSATFTALRFVETPRVFAVALSHPLVRQQLQFLSSGSVQRFVNQRDLDGLLVPVLGRIWREDFEARLARAMQRRREALVARAALIEAADSFLRGEMA